MTTPAQYRHQLDALKLAEIPTDGLKPGDAQQSLLLLQDLTRQAQEIERSVTLQIQALRAQYQARRASAQAGASSRIMVSNKRRMGGKMRQEEMEKLDAERDEKIGPLEEIKKEVEELLAQAAVARQKLE